jgi:hypothetical protein
VQPGTRGIPRRAGSAEQHPVAGPDVPAAETLRDSKGRVIDRRTSTERLRTRSPRFVGVVDRRCRSQGSHRYCGCGFRGASTLRFATPRRVRARREPNGFATSLMTPHERPADTESSDTSAATVGFAGLLRLGSPRRRWARPRWGGFRRCGPTAGRVTSWKSVCQRGRATNPDQNADLGHPPVTLRRKDLPTRAGRRDGSRDADMSTKWAGRRSVSRRASLRLRASLAGTGPAERWGLPSWVDSASQPKRWAVPSSTGGGCAAAHRGTGGGFGRRVGAWPPAWDEP